MEVLCILDKYCYFFFTENYFLAKKLWLFFPQSHFFLSLIGQINFFLTTPFFQYFLERQFRAEEHKVNVLARKAYSLHLEFYWYICINPILRAEKIYPFGIFTILSICVCFFCAASLSFFPFHFVTFHFLLNFFSYCFFHCSIWCFSFFLSL